MSIEITVLFDVVPDRMDSVTAAFQELCEATRKEEGALRFDALRSEEHPNIVVLVEDWADQEAIDLHMKEPYVADFLARTEGAFTHPPYVHRLRALDA
ncbi:putative quinol monooxygenase [Streptomyces sp. AC627_RSS907]|uniref:putative quinol monooxygenase n=1 Tax=Streptomyces sp. AC627_RSS907 TaxID=2823684 RepID=UPI001C2234CB|nr:putative quinol monooxygenase [Streptomyces sp. AC627_RSS907]